MRTLLAFAAYAGFAMAQASTPTSTVPLVNTITTTILSTTSTVVSTSISTVSTSSCSTSTGTDGQATATCKSSFAVQPVDVYGQAVLTITTSIVTTTGYSTIYAAAAGSQTQVQSQISTIASIQTSTSAYSSPAASVSSTGTASHTTVHSQSFTTTKLTTASSSRGAANSPASSSATQSQQSSGTSPGTIAAIVIAVFLGLALLGVGAFFFKRRQTKSGAHGIPRITLDTEKGKPISLDRTTGAALGKSDTCSETTGLTHSAPPTPSTPRDGFPDDVQDRYEMCTTPSRVHEMDARPTYSPFPPRRGK